MAAITSGGAIPDNANYLVVAEPEGATVGTVDEDFAVESMAGDVFLLGTYFVAHTARGKRARARGRRARGGAVDSILEWRSARAAPRNYPPRSRGCGRILWRSPSPNGYLPKRVSTAWARTRPSPTCNRVRERWACCRPTTHVVAERFFDEGGGMQFVLHAPFGARVNRAWGLALRKRFCRTFNFELQAAATDNGIVLSLGEQHSFPLEVVFEFLRPETVEDVLTQALLDAPMFTARWRWNASRALAILRFSHGGKVPAPIQRMRVRRSAGRDFPGQAACPENLTGPPRIPDHPLVRETIRNCLHEAMDLTGLMAVLQGIRSGDSAYVGDRHAGGDAVFARDPERQSLRVSGRCAAGGAPHARSADCGERCARILWKARARLDPDAIVQVAAESWPVVRDADELHEALLTLITVPPVPEWEPLFRALVDAGRAATLRAGGAEFWMPAERSIHRTRGASGRGAQPPDPIRGRPPRNAKKAAPLKFCAGGLNPAVRIALRNWRRGWRCRRPAGGSALAQLEAEGQILRGRFTPGVSAEEPEWCHRRLLARIHRLTIGPSAPRDRAGDYGGFRTLPASLAASRAGHTVARRGWRAARHQATSGLRDFGGRVGIRDPAQARGALQPGVSGPALLSGEVMWGRLSPHPAFDTREDGRTHRVRPTRVAPLTLFLREDAEWLLAGPQPAPDASLSHPAREVLAELQRRGASFFPELARATGRLASEVEDALWELVAAGLVTADGFENLRALVDPKRRRGEGRGRLARPRHAAGRWALLRRPATGSE